MEQIIIVTTKEQLQKALDQQVPRIIVKGNLAEELNSGMKIKEISKWALTLLLATLGATPFTGGLTALAALPIMAVTGIELAVIVAVIALGTSLIFLIIREYKKVRFTGKAGNTEAELVLERSEDPSGIKKS
jgi:hypothetical protein